MGEGKGIKKIRNNIVSLWREPSLSAIFCTDAKIEVMCNFLGLFSVRLCCITLINPIIIMWWCCLSPQEFDDDGQQVLPVSSLWIGVKAAQNLEVGYLKFQHDYSSLEGSWNPAEWLLLEQLKCNSIRSPSLTFLVAALRSCCMVDCQWSCYLVDLEQRH